MLSNGKIAVVPGILVKANKTPPNEINKPPIPKNTSFHSVSFDRNVVYSGRNDIISPEGIWIPIMRGDDNPAKSSSKILTTANTRITTRAYTE